jgi:ribose transport system substrate-binding protein
MSLRLSRRLGALLALCCLGGTTLAALLACGDAQRGAVSSVTTGPPAAATAPDSPPAARVALIMKTLTNPFFVEMERGARRGQREFGLDLQVRTATQETSIDQQIQLVDSEIRAGARAIVIAPGDATRLVPVLKRAQDAGIHIVNIDNRLNATAMAAAGMRPVPFISVDNERGAFLAVQHLAARVRQPTQAAIIEGIRTADNAQQRRRGAERALREHAHISLVATESANWKIDEAYAVAGALFKRHPHIGVLFCANDMMAIGAIKFLQETGRTGVLVAGFDALDEARTAIRAGQMTVTVDQQAAEQGYLGIRTARRLIDGDETVALEHEVDARLVTGQMLK